MALSSLGSRDEVQALGTMDKPELCGESTASLREEGDLYNEYPGKHSRFTRRSVFTLDSSLDSPDNVFLKRYRFPVTHEIQRQYIVLFASREVSTGARL